VTVAEELIAFASKQEMLAKSKPFWNPDKTQFWIDSGVPLVIDRREGYPDWFTGIRQDGLVMGLEFGHPQGAKYVMKRLYENRVWAIFSTLDPSVLQYKPGILLAPAVAGREQ
jgi:hypothetical protein